MYLTRWWCAVFFLTFLGSGNHAAAQNLDDYLEEIRIGSPAYRAAYERWQAARERIKVAKALPDPTVQLGVFAQEVETRVGPQKQRIGVSQVIPWKGKLALKGQRASRLAEKAKSELDAITLKLETEFKTLFADLYYIGRSIAITEDHLKLLKNLNAVITQRYETNAAKYNDMIRIQIEIDALADRLETQKASAPPVHALMNAILGRPVHQAIPFPDTIPMLDTAKNLEYEDVVNALPRRNPMLQALEHQISADRVALGLAKKDYYPDFKVGLDWINTGSAINPAQPESGKDPIMVSVGINLPMWRKKYSAAERSAAYSLTASEQRRHDAQSHLEADLRRALFKLDDANRKIRLYQDQIIPKAEESLSVLTSGFQTGDSSYLDLIDAEKALLEFLLSLSQAQANQLKAVTSIESILGEPPIEKE